eukprot:scaffold5240_cov50-Attheya_sp.AAC.3
MFQIKLQTNLSNQNLLGFNGVFSCAASNALVADALLVPLVIVAVGDSVSLACSPSVPPWSTGGPPSSS